MRACFKEVLARESASLAAVTDGDKLSDWRHRVVTELMTPRSPYVLVLRQTGDVCERSEFLARWRQLIADAIDRIMRTDETAAGSCPATRTGRRDVDAQQTAVLILAALHGGCTLSNVTQDQWPLNAALDMALAPFVNGQDRSRGDTETVPPGQ